MSDMQEIVPIFKSTIDDNSANARDLYNFLEIGRDFSNWIKSKIQACDLEIGVDYIMEVFAKSGESGGKPMIEYTISSDAAKHISMTCRGDKPKQLRQYFIDAEKKLRNNNTSIPTPLDEAIKNANLALSLARGNVSEDYMKKMTIESARRIDKKHGSKLIEAFDPLEVAKIGQVEQDITKPAHLLDRAIGSVEYSTNQIASALSITNGAFYKALIDLGIVYLYRKNGNKQPSGHIITKGHEKLVRQQKLNDGTASVIKGFYFDQFDEDLKKLITNTAQKYMNISFKAKVKK